MDEIINDEILDDHVFLLLEEVMQLINAEIQWCYQNPMKGLVTKHYQMGFTDGLSQAKTLILALARSGSKDALEAYIRERAEQAQGEGEGE